MSDTPKKASEVADAVFHGRPALMKREAESNHDFATRLVDALYAENDLPQPNEKRCDHCGTLVKQLNDGGK